MREPSRSAIENLSKRYLNHVVLLMADASTLGKISRWILGPLDPGSFAIAHHVWSRQSARSRLAAVTTPEAGAFFAAMTRLATVAVADQPRRRHRRRAHLFVVDRDPVSTTREEWPRVNF
jgi:hypothetical protein